MICFLFALFLLNGKFVSIHGSNTLQLSRLERYEGVKYLTYTKTNKNRAVDVRNVNFDDANTSVFIIHGFEAKDLVKPVQAKNDLFKYDSTVERVIIVDWRVYSGTDTYLKVADKHVPRLAQDLYEKMVHIRKNGAKNGAIQIVGYSIGAHVAGQTGRLLQKNDGYKLDQIFGLDPVGDYFRDHPDRAIQNGDAKNVRNLHTNKNNYGFGKQIGVNDTNINGGEKQPNCKINVNKCSHYEAWNAFSSVLANKSAAKSVKPDVTDARMHPYVICLDVSLSMRKENRLKRATISAQKTISDLKYGSYLGLVKFSGTSAKVHDIIQLTGSADRKSLRDSIPTEYEAGTSIGNGLRISLDMLQAMPNSKSFCSTIVLITDGEENTPKYVNDVLPAFENICVKVSTIALGKDASQALEKLSNDTGGSVAYSPEDKTGKDLVGTIKAFSYLFEGQTEKPVRLLTKDLKLTSGEEIVEFTVDDTIGNQTEFSVISHEIDKIDVRLKSPHGHLYFLNSSEYFTDDYAQKGFRIQYAEDGQWNLIVSKNSNTKRSTRSSIDLTALGTSHERGSTPPILLNAEVSHRVLEYPKPITITAELKFGEYPIVYSEIFAHIVAPGEWITLPLYDDGIYPDDLANDGIYTNDIVALPNPERYSISVTALSNNTAMSPQKEINYLLKDVVDCKTTQNCKKLNRFQREAEVGAIKLASNFSLDKIPPHPVSDLRGTIENAKQKIISLEWTYPRNDRYSQIKRYDIRALVNGTDFEMGFKFEESHIVKGSLDAANSTNKNAKISIRIPKNEWDIVIDNNLNELKFAMKSIGHNNEISDISDIVCVVINGATSSISKLTSPYHLLLTVVVIVLLLLKLN